jgi:hypothetical protein
MQVRSIPGDEEEIRQGQTSQASQPQTKDEGTQKGIPNCLPNQTIQKCFFAQCVQWIARQSFLSFKWLCQREHGTKK